MPSAALLCFTIGTLATILIITGLVIIIEFAYLPIVDSLEKTQCTIISMTKSYQYVDGNYQNGNYDPYFYDVRTGDTKYIWLKGSYFVIDAISTPHYADGNAIYTMEFLDGYTVEADRNTAYSEVILNVTSIPCWYNRNDDKQITVNSQTLLVGPSWGIAIMVIAAAITITITILMVCYL